MTGRALAGWGARRAARDAGGVGLGRTGCVLGMCARVLIALVVMWIPMRASAWNVVVEGCEGAPRDDAPLRARVALETGEPVTSDDEGAGRITIQGPCGDSLEMQVVLELVGLRLEQRIALAPIAEHLRTRTLALLIGAMVESAQQLATRSFAPEPEPEPEPEVARAIPVPAQPDPVAIEPAPPEPPRLQVALRAGGRVYVDGGTVLGGARAALAYDWLDLEVGVDAGHGELEIAAADAALVLAAVGARFVRVAERRLAFALGAYLEGGLLWADTTARQAGYVGVARVSAVIGGFLRARMDVALDRALALHIGVDGGVDYGPELSARGARLLSVAGFFAALHLGLALEP